MISCSELAALRRRADRASAINVDAPGYESLRDCVLEQAELIRTLVRIVADLATRGR